MKQMRVLNCTKEDREIIFKIADKVGCPVDEYARKRWSDTMEYIGKKYIIYDGEKVIGSEWHGDYGNFNNASFSEFITELLKYEKPKKWVVKESDPAQVEISHSGRKSFTYVTFGNIRSPKFTYEVEE